MSFTALCYLIVPGPILRLMTNNPEIIQSSISLLFVVAFFQIPDGIQVTLWGVLKGLKVARLPFLLTIIGHYLIGLPIGLYLAFSKGHQVEGLWIGLTVGLYIMALGLGAILLHRLKTLSFPTPLKESKSAQENISQSE